jgi:hypothetical protein
VSRKLGKKELMDLIEGAALLGSGGGGSPKAAIKMLDKIFEKKDFIEIVSPEEISDNARVVVSAGMGSPAVLLKEGWKGEETYAFERMEKIIGKIDYVTPVETGGFNSFTAIHNAAVKDLPVIDGDGAGRAIPELEQTTFYLGGVPIEPICLADSKGSSALLYPTNAYIGEEMARAITTVYGMRAGVACYPMNGKQLKATVIPGTLTLSERVGKALREGKKEGKDIVEVALERIDGYLLAKGKVKKKTEEVKAGFDYGKVSVGEIVVDYKNENMMAWKGSKPIAMVPDSICWLGIDGKPLTNADIKEGMKVAVIGKRAHDKWRVPEGFKVFKHILKLLGYEGEYKPIEELVANS